MHHMYVGYMYVCMCTQMSWQHMCQLQRLLITGESSQSEELSPGIVSNPGHMCGR